MPIRLVPESGTIELPSPLREMASLHRELATLLHPMLDGNRVVNDYIVSLLTRCSQDSSASEGVRKRALEVLGRIPR